MHFCLIDDDAQLLATLRQGLVELGHECEVYSSAVEGLERLLDRERPEPDLLLLDVMMPEMDGWQVLSKLREAGRRTAVIYVTAKSEISDRVRGLRLTADDYVIKPFALEELLARAEGVMRRRGFREPIRVEGLVIHRAHQRVEVDGRSLDVTPREHAFLELLAEREGETLSRPELLRRLWDIDFDPQTNVVEVFVARLRRKLGPSAAHLIGTVIGKGYRLERPAPRT